MRFPRWLRTQGADPDQPAGFPVAWRQILEERWPLWATLSDDERTDLEDRTLRFIADTRWEAAQGFELTDEVIVLIAAQACLLTLGLEGDPLHAVRTIIVHASTIVLRGERPVGGGLVSDAPYPILGQTGHRGPVVIAWDEAARNARHPERGHNVVFHELAHQLDLLDGTVDGTPPLADDAARQRWIDVCTAEYRALRAGDGGPLLDPYAGVDPGEFFAVVTEVFFSRGADLRAAKPELYELLAGYYRQDPAARPAVRP